MSSNSEQDNAALRDFLATRDIPCPACKYNLRGLTSPACPECNQALTLRVGLVDAAHGAYIAALIALSVGAGAALLLLVGVTVISIVEAGGPEMPDEVFCLITYPFVGAAILGAGLALLASRRGRRRFMALSTRARRVIAAGAWLLTIGGFVVWLLLAVRL